jgi:hypothetical protein
MTAAVAMILGAVAWSWAWWAASIVSGGTETAVGALTYLTGGFGPTVAVILTLRRSSRDYRERFRRRLFDWRVAPGWWAAALALAVFPKLIATGVAALAGHTATGESIGWMDVPFALAFGAIAVSIEEPLWRGVALDKFGAAAVKASLVIGIFWSAWHIPLFAVEGTFQEELGLGTVDFFVFLVGVVGLSVFLTWLVLGAGGSIFIAMVTHVAINMTGYLLPDDTTIRLLEMVVIWSAAALMLWRLAARERLVGSPYPGGKE